MDDIVTAALNKWPHVPACYGWLALDQRGDWYMRDAATQQAGPFPASKGSRIDHDRLQQFIARNYTVDDQGAWYFQNGPQRVYVTLETSPWILRSQAHHHWSTHTGQRILEVTLTCLDENDRLFVHTPLGLALVHSQDMYAAAHALETHAWPMPQHCPFAQLPSRFGFMRDPQARQG